MEPLRRFRFLKPTLVWPGLAYRKELDDHVVESYTLTTNTINNSSSKNNGSRRQDASVRQASKTP